MIAAFQLPFVQTFAAQKAAAFLSERLQTKVMVKKLAIRFVKSLVLKEVYVQDLQQDTLLYAGSLLVDVRAFSFADAHIHLENAYIQDGFLSLKSDQSGVLNLDFLTHYFAADSSKDTLDKAKKTYKKPFSLQIDALDFQNLRFSYQKFDSENLPCAINFEDIAISKMQGKLQNLRLDSLGLSVNIKQWAFVEKSGFQLKSLSASVYYGAKSIEFKSLNLLTSHSRLSDYLALNYQKISDFTDFIHKINIQADFKNAELSFQDLAYFAPNLSGNKLRLGLTGLVTGTVSHLQSTDLTVLAGQSSYLQADFSLKGLPNLQQTMLLCNFKQLHTHSHDLTEILQAVNLNRAIQPPDLLNRLGAVYFTGKSSGLLSNFNIDGQFKTDIGSLYAALSFTQSALLEPVYAGKIRTEDLNLGAFLAVSALGKSKLEANLAGSGFDLASIDISLDARLDALEWNHYTYQAIGIVGSLRKAMFDGSIAINDPNICFALQGSANFDLATSAYNFRANVQEANLQALNIRPDPFVFSVGIDAQFTGNNFENLQGFILVDTLHIANHNGVYEQGSLRLIAAGHQEDRILRFTSDALDASVKGIYNLPKLFASVKKLVKANSPRLDLGIITSTNRQVFDFDIRLKRPKAVVDLLFPGWFISDEGFLSGHIDTDENNLYLDGFVQTIRYENKTLDSLIVKQRTQSDGLDLELRLQNLMLDTTRLENLVFRYKLQADTLWMHAGLGWPLFENHLNVNAKGVLGMQSTQFSLLPSALVLQGKVWDIAPDFLLTHSPGSYSVQHFKLSQGLQSIALNGIASALESDSLQINAKQIDLSSFDFLLKPLGFSLAGTLNAEINAKSALSAPQINSDLKVSNLVLNQQFLGDAALASAWNGLKKVVDFNFHLTENEQSVLAIAGFLNPEKQGNLQAEIVLQPTNLITLQPFLTGLVHNLGGQVSLHATITGSPSEPKINGVLGFLQADMTVDYLQTAYRIQDQLKIRDNKIVLDELCLTDVKGKKAVAKGYIDFTGSFADPLLSVDIHAKDFQVLNTKQSDNALYYGDIYASGKFSFHGLISKLAIRIDAQTIEGSNLFLPTSRQASTGNQNLVVFVAKQKAGNISKKQLAAQNSLDLDIKLQLTDQAKINIIFDESSGEGIQGRGNANLNMQISAAGDFKIFGNYTISWGEYRFATGAFLTKDFQIEPGGTLVFVGSLPETQLNIRALYKTRASLNNIYAAVGATMPDTQKGIRLPVHALINLTGSIEQLKPDFEIIFPNETSFDISSIARSYFDNKEHQNTQALALLFTGGFIASSVGLGSGAESVFYEAVANQFSNFANQYLNSRFIDVNAKFDEQSVGLGSNIRLLNNRLFINGTIAGTHTQVVPTNLVNNQVVNPLTGSVEIDYLLSKKQNLRIRIFNRTNDYRQLSVSAIEENPLVVGFGLLYKKEFDSWNGIFPFYLFRKKLPKKKSPQPK